MAFNDITFTEIHACLTNTHKYMHIFSQMGGDRKKKPNKVNKREKSRSRGTDRNEEKRHGTLMSASCSGYTALPAHAAGMFTRNWSYFCLCMQDFCVHTNVCMCDINWQIIRGSDFPQCWLCISTQLNMAVDQCPLIHTHKHTHWSLFAV